MSGCGYGLRVSNNTALWMDRLQPVALLEIMSREEATKEQSLPSTFSPSDHLPMICDFALTLE
jgi:hypothetical protein